MPFHCKHDESCHLIIWTGTVYKRWRDVPSRPQCWQSAMPFLQSSKLGPPPPLGECVPFPFCSEGTHSRGGEGVGGSQFGWGDRNCGTLGIYCMYFVISPQLRQSYTLVCDFLQAFYVISALFFFSFFRAPSPVFVRPPLGQLWRVYRKTSSSSSANAALWPYFGGFLAPASQRRRLVWTQVKDFWISGKGVCRWFRYAQLAKGKKSRP